MKINTKILEGEWFKYGKGKNKIELLIRPFPNSMNSVTLDGKVTMGAYAYHTFTNCVLDWKDITDIDDKPLECNEENKKMIFDYTTGLSAFVDDTQSKLKEKFDREVKN